ncbi:MAG TPA: hypothetical protein PKE12_12425 [Kiritimatiellia bacterium]|nr:hypothetical protein [Kiritimatiellia bacterium]
MKLQDQPDAKIRHWAQHPKPARLPRIANLPRFGSRKFNSHTEFNAWKQELILELIRRGGAKWTP